MACYCVLKLLVIYPVDLLLKPIITFKIDADTFKLCTDKDLTLPVTASDTDTGADYEVSNWGLGDGSTTFNLPNMPPNGPIKYIIKS